MQYYYTLKQLIGMCHTQEAVNNAMQLAFYFPFILSRLVLGLT